MADLYFIVNPVAGAGMSLATFAKVEAILQAKNVDYQVAHSDYPGHAVVLAQEAAHAGHGCVVAVGGDGTAKEVAQELVNTGTVMGLIPSGTGNDLARALRIPTDPEKAISILLNSQSMAIDAATVNDKLYFNVAGFGFDVDVLYYTERYKEKHKGLTAYMLGLLRALFGLKLRKVTVVSREKTVEKNALIVAVANGTHFGGGMNVAPLADPADGYLDVCVVHDVNRLHVLFVLMEFVKGRHLSLKYVTYWKTKALEVMATPASKLQLDGEVGGQTPASFRILPGALLMRTGL